LTTTCEVKYAIRGPQGFLCKKIGDLNPYWDHGNHLELYFRATGRPKLWLFNSKAEAMKKIRDLGEDGLRAVVAHVING